MLGSLPRESKCVSGNTNSGALGSRAWINPFTGAFPTNPRPEQHAGHVHTGTSHRVLVEASDLNTTLNPGATYYMEVQYDRSSGYAWCMAHPGQCNMFNNASYRRYNVTGTTSFTFSPAAHGANVPGDRRVDWSDQRDDRARGGSRWARTCGLQSDEPIAGVWHYEYLIHNQNLDRRSSLSVSPGMRRDYREQSRISRAAEWSRFCERCNL